MMPTCKLCGRCCHLIIDNKLSKKKCKYLAGKLCRVFKDRLDRDLGHGNHCSMRENVHYNYEGCPFNKPEWEDIPK